MSSVSQCKRAQHVGARSNSTAHVVCCRLMKARKARNSESRIFRPTLPSTCAVLLLRAPTC